jgi:tetratricopeptide (TPR) repeat protein
MQKQPDMDIILDRLDRIIGDGPARCHFNNPVAAGAIKAFEKRHGLRLPGSYKAFLSFTDGGMIVDEDLHAMIKNDPDGLETAKWNANYLYGLEELEQAYIELKNWNFGIPSANIAIYPFIPICHTSTGEHLVLISLRGDEAESPVLDAFHEETPETWGVVADTFAEFLDDYISSGGRPGVLGDLARGCALDYVEPMEEDNRPEAVIARNTRLLEEEHDDAWLLTERGMAYRDLGLMHEALGDFNRAIAIKPDDAFYYYNRGDLYLRAGKHRAALIEFDIAVKLEPDDTLYLDSRAEVLSELGKYDKALNDVNKSISIDEKDILAYIIRESIYKATGEEEKALEDSNRIDELQNEDQP